MDKINIVSSQAVLDMPSFTLDVLLATGHSPVRNQLFKTATDINKLTFQFIHTKDLSLVDTMLHDSSYLVIHSTEIWAVWRRLGARKFGVS